MLIFTTHKRSNEYIILRIKSGNQRKLNRHKYNKDRMDTPIVNHNSLTINREEEMIHYAIQRYIVGNANECAVPSLVDRTKNSLFLAFWRRRWRHIVISYTI